MSELAREHYEGREEWLSARSGHGIGGSEAAAIVNMSPYMTVRDLWERKVLHKQSEDISDNEYVAKGVRVEPVLRELYRANHPNDIIEHYPYDLLYQDDRPWLFATLDGEIIRSDESHGVLEIKTATPNGKAGWAKWEGQIPQNYYIQNLHQLLASGFDFVVLFAGLYAQDGAMTIREYEFTKEDVADDMAWLLQEEESFWESVENKKMPSLTLVI